MEESNNINFTDIEIKNKIFNVRGMQVMIDSDLAKLYEVETKRLNEQVKRNIDRFPVQFCFQLLEEEFEILRSQNATSIIRGGRTHLPYVFTEQGVAMLAGILNSKIAVKISIQIINAFVLMRKTLKYNTYIFQRLDILEKNRYLDKIESDKNFEKIFNLLENNTIEIKEGVFFEGQVFDAHKFVSDLIRNACKSIILIDNYIDESILYLFTKRSHNVKVIIYTENISKQINLDLNKYNSQYAAIEIKELKNCHDRFLIIDKSEIYHFGTSLKDLGKKLFAFSKLEKEGFKIFEKIDN